MILILNKLKNLVFWMLELIIIYYFNKKIFNAELYNHQKLSFFITIFPIIFKVVSIILSSINVNKNDPGFVFANNKLIIPIGIALYIILLILDAYILTKIKWIMDIKYISISEILMYFGFFGIIFYLIISFISLFKLCPKFLINNIYNKDNANDNETFYNFQNFYLYTKELEGKKNLILEEIL